MRDYLSTKNVVLFVSLVFGATLAMNMLTHRQQLEHIVTEISHYRETSHIVPPIPTRIIYPTPTTQPDTQESEDLVRVEPINAQPEVIYTDPDDALPWGVAEQVDDVTYTIRVRYDEHMGTPTEIMDAINQYRATKGVGGLSWDDRLGEYAQSRADHFESIQGTDKHAGFNTYLENEDGFNKLEFNRLGENSFFGGTLTGTHLIEWVFSQSPGHDANQTDSGWSHIGVGTSASSVNIIFGSGKF